MSSPRPADFELAILRVLWRRGAATVREVHEELLAERQQGYTTVLKSLQIMFEKGLVTRDETQRSHTYFAAVEEGATRTNLVQDLANKAFGGSALKLLMHALNGERPRPEELDAIQALIESKRKEAE
jgi:BlaI family transcriptional regulator, penicillinase repressor